MRKVGNGRFFSIVFILYKKETMANPTAPILVSPSDMTLVIGNHIVFVFVVPSDTDNDILVFRIELDTNNPPSSSSGSYKVNESRFSHNLKTNGNWQVKNSGGSYVQMPTGGVDSTYYGRDARVIIRKQDTPNFPDINGMWYWRISAGDGMLQAPIFNKVIFGQAIFGGV